MLVGGLEHWDDLRQRWVLYRDDHSHSADCKRFPFETIPSRAFLDTSVVNLLIKYAATIFDLATLDQSLPHARRRDIEALLHIFEIGARANWTLIASAKTLDEVSQTKDDGLRKDLSNYVLDLVERGTPASEHGNDLGRRLSDSSLLRALPDRGDRELLGNAIGLGCDAFVTVDVRTIIARRDKLPRLPLRILSPIEWWAHVKPWGALWA